MISCGIGKEIFFFQMLPDEDLGELLLSALEGTTLV